MNRALAVSPGALDEERVSVSCSQSFLTHIYEPKLWCPVFFFILPFWCHLTREFVKSARSKSQEKHTVFKSHDIYRRFHVFTLKQKNNIHDIFKSDAQKLMEAPRMRRQNMLALSRLDVFAYEFVEIGAEDFNDQCFLLMMYYLARLLNIRIYASMYNCDLNKFFNKKKSNI